MSRQPAIMSKLIATFKELPEILYTVFKYPLLLALLGLNGAVVIPVFIVGTAVYGFASLGLLFLVESPAIYYVVREAMRQVKMLPMSETWETSPEKWNQALQDFASMVNKKKTKAKA